MSKIPFLTIGNDELKDNENVTDIEICPKCGEKHKVRYLAFVDCENDSYLVGINGKRLR